MGCIAGSHSARTGAMCTWWAVFQQLPAPVSPGARLDGGWAGISASAGGCSITTTHTCILPPSAAPVLHHPGSLPWQLRALGMGCPGVKAPSSTGLHPRCQSTLRGQPPPGTWRTATQRTKACGEHLCPCPAQPPCPALVLSSNWVPWFPSVGLQPLLKPRGC